MCSLCSTDVNFNIQRVNTLSQSTLYDVHHEQKHTRSATYALVTRKRFQPRIMVITV